MLNQTEGYYGGVLHGLLLPQTEASRVKADADFATLLNSCTNLSAHLVPQFAPPSC